MTSLCTHLNEAYLFRRLGASVDPAPRDPSHAGHRIAGDRRNVDAGEPRVWNEHKTYPVPILRLTTGDPALSGPDCDRRLIVTFQWPCSVCRSDLAMRRCDHLAPRRIGPIRGCAGSRDASFCLAWTLGAKLSHWRKFDVRKCCGLKQLDVR